MDPLSITCAVITVGGFAIKCAVQLNKTVHGLQDQNRRTRALQDEVVALVDVLQSLLDTINRSDPDAAFGTLEDLLQQCGEACETYSQLLATKLTKDSASIRASMRGWFNQKRYLDDVAEFKEIISAYKSTITIAIVTIHLRLTTSIRKESLDNYKYMMSDTEKDLTEHIHNINHRIGDLASHGPQGDDLGSAEWRDLLAKKRCAQQGLEFCAQLSCEIERREPGLHAAFSEVNAPRAREYWENGVDDTKSSVQAMESNFQKYKEEIEQEMQNMPSFQTQLAAELEDLQKAKDGMEKCLQVVSQAEKHANKFDNIYLSGNSGNVTVSTTGKAVHVSNVTALDRSFNVGGQMGGAELMALLEGFGRTRRAEYLHTSAGADASFAGPSRPERTQSMGNARDWVTELPRVTAASRKSLKDRGSSSSRDTVSPGVVLCESPTAFSASRTTL